MIYCSALFSCVNPIVIQWLRQSKLINAATTGARQENEPWEYSTEQQQTQQQTQK